jgi:stearoyl-CoA desaturase (delta-9 desaturase)
LNASSLGSLTLPKRRSLFRAVVDNVNKVPFVAIHLAVILVFFVPFSWAAVGLCAATYALRVFALTAGYHRYFSHRAYKTSRVFQFILAALGCSALQRGPLWWAANHRSHHKYSDQEEDPHSPVRHGVWWSHIGWVLSPQEENINPNEEVPDFSKYPELRFLERFHWVPAVSLAGLCYALLGWSGVVWGFILSTVLVYHATFMVNSVCHVFGSRRFATTDASRNNWFVALLVFGEGWHNNHHHYMSSANQGIKWWEVDVSYYVLKILSVPRIVWDLRGVPANKMIPTA